MWVRFPPSPMTNVTEFQRESRRIDQLIWDAMSLVEDERVLFCGSANDAAWVRRAAEIGAEVVVIESDAARLALLADLGIRTLRGSTTMIPARDSSFDAVVAFHYLHEIDPTFHAQTVSELARVGRRVIVVEPAPPSDLLGKRITELYSRAKYEAGSFEEYQPSDYWRKLLAIVKAAVVVQQFTFTRIAPKFLIEDTVALILSAMAIEDMPKGYIDELRELARRSDAQLSPLSRYVLVGLPGGEEARAAAGTWFRPEDEQLLRPAPSPVPVTALPATGVAAAVAAAAAAAAGSANLEGAEFPPVIGPGGRPIVTGAPQPFVPPQVRPGESPFAPPPATPPPPASAPEPAFGLPVAGAPPPAILPQHPPAAAPAPEPAEAAFGIPTPPAPPPATSPGGALGTPFALPEDPDPFGLEADPERRPGMGWTWEPPEGGDEEDFGDFGLPKP
jgi:hypothetical protein